MDTYKLKYFVTIAESGSLSKASQILGISHSGLSKAIGTLEAESKLKLFRPHGRGLEITSEGKWFYQKAREILMISDQMLNRQMTENPLIRIGLSGVIAMTCAGLLAEEFREQLLIREIDIGELEGNIMNDEIDFGIAFVPSPQPELQYLELGQVRFSSYAREDLAKKALGTSIPFTTPISGFPANPMGYKNRDGWPNDIPRSLQFAVSGFAIALDLLRSGKSAIYMPDFVAALENERNRFRVIAVKEHQAAHTTRALFLVKRQTSEESKHMRKISKIVRKVCCSKN